MRQDDACFLAFDTSCYSTSFAVVANGRVLCDKRAMLTVPEGSRGLRQSEAVFGHVKNYEQLFLDYAQQGYTIKAIGYSEKPCPREGSYMPVFRVGQSYAAALAGVLGVGTYALTHQHGHIYGAYFGHALADGVYCAFHVSGGTLEILRVAICGRVITEISAIGGSRDITCGQLIDRVGVAAGLAFPSGRYMERMYTSGGVKLPVCVHGLYANLSGAETQALRLIAQGADAASVCSGVIDCVADTLVRLIGHAAEAGMRRFIFTGGVVCNAVIRERIAQACGEYDCLMAQKQYCGDNACGLALAAEILYHKGEGI